MTEIITSSSNTKIKLVRALQTRTRHRQSESAFVAEGVRLLEEAAQVNWPTQFVLYDKTISDRGQRLVESLRSRKNLEISEITTELMASISDTETPQGILAVLERKALSLPKLPTFIVIVDQIRDPGNMGTLLRTAEASGADAVLISPGTVDAYAPKVVRSGMGAHFYLPIKHQTWPEIRVYVGTIPVILAKSEGGIPLWEANMRQPCAVLIGGEAFGASKSGEEIATQIVTIPMRGRAESLNAAVAGSIIMAEILRQRYSK